MVGEEFPEEILFAVRAAPHHDAKQTLKVRRVHDDDYFIGRKFFLLDLNAFQLSLYPLRTATIALCNLCMSLFSVCELFPNFFRLLSLLLAAFFVARTTFPDLPSVVCTVLLERLCIATRTYFS